MAAAQGTFVIESNVEVASGTFRTILRGDASALTRPGQFIDIALDGKFLRRPFAAATWTGESITIYYKLIGEGTRLLSTLPAGTPLDVLTGLGNGFTIPAKPSRILLISGGLGASPL